ncbi:type III secretion system chaperone [Bremerella sp. JC770]|uniref:type III secretion system chaperone n=1 Tax=Bremerella sp. JC770 TaxID=3232137 RepID=UPI003458710E
MSTGDFADLLSRWQGRSIDRREMNRILKRLGKSLRVRGLELDEDGVVSLNVNGNTEIALMHFDGLAGLIANAAFPEEWLENHAVLTEALRLNTYWTELEGASFGLVPPRLVLARFLPLPSGRRDALECELDRFYQIFQICRAHLSQVVRHATDWDSLQKTLRDSDNSSVLRV